MGLGRPRTQTDEAEHSDLDNQLEQVEDEAELSQPSLIAMDPHPLPETPSAGQSEKTATVKHELGDESKVAGPAMEASSDKPARTLGSTIREALAMPRREKDDVAGTLKRPERKDSIGISFIHRRTNTDWSLPGSTVTDDTDIDDEFEDNTPAQRPLARPPSRSATLNSRPPSRASSLALGDADISGVMDQGSPPRRPFVLPIRRRSSGLSRHPIMTPSSSRAPPHEPRVRSLLGREGDDPDTRAPNPPMTPPTAGLLTINTQVGGPLADQRRGGVSPIPEEADSSSAYGDATPDELIESGMSDDSDMSDASDDDDDMLHHDRPVSRRPDYALVEQVCDKLLRDVFGVQPEDLDFTAADAYQSVSYCLEELSSIVPGSSISSSSPATY